LGLAIFDLDNTLLAGDSDHLWGTFLVDIGAVDADQYGQANHRFYAQYVAGTLDIDEFLRFSLQPLAQHPAEQLYAWRAQFIRENIAPIVLPAAQNLVAEHRRRGDIPLIITATNHFITEPIAALFGVEHLLATRPEKIDGQYTGRYLGTPTFREGKIANLKLWLREHNQELSDSWFYSDSHNDLPLLMQVTNPVAVDPDDKLRHHAVTHQWRVMTLRDG
jgi:HAD superfamily hydrolase (TIGR01490 family)